MLALLAALAVPLATSSPPAPPHLLTTPTTVTSLVRPHAPTPLAVDSFVVTGRVTSSVAQRPIGGATITVVGTPIATRTDRAGAYRLALVAPAGAASITLRAEQTGFAPVTRLVAITRAAGRADFVLAAAPTGPVVAEAHAASPAAVHDAAQLAVRSSTVARKAIGGVAAPAPLPFTAERRRGEPDWLSPGNREQYAYIDEHPFLAAARTPLSTFSIDVDRASYTNVRRFLDSGTRPPRDAVRLEELVNYFHYDYAAPPRGGAPLDVTVETHAAPWAPTHRLVRIGMQAQRLPIAELPPANLVFLIDVSGSMQDANKLPLVKQSLRLLAQELRPQDRVAIAVYAGAAGLVLPSTPGSQRETILDALDRLEAGGSTNGAEGIRLAYRTARANFLREGANRVILATDGDFNVGTTSDSDLIQLITQERRSGVHLTVLGFGMGNLQDAKMEQLADKGDGQYAYIDNLAEAQKALVREMGGTLFTLAKDVKLQVEFNPSRVRAYRLLGYENRRLRDEDFNDDTKDAGELGAGHSVTALYEVVLTDDASDVRTGSVDPLRYRTTPRSGSPGLTRDTSRSAASTSPRSASDRDELAYVKVRWQPPRGGTSVLRGWAVRESVGAPTTDYLFASAVAGFGMLLRDSEHKGTLTWHEVRRLAERGRGADRDGDRADFLRLIDAAERITRHSVAER